MATPDRLLRKVVQQLRQPPYEGSQGHSLDSLAEDLGISRLQVALALSILIPQGKVVEVNDAYYELTEEL